MRLRVPRGARRRRRCCATSATASRAGRGGASTRRPRPRRGGARRFPVVQPGRPYRWLLAGRRRRLRVAERARRRRAHDVPDADDFVLAIGAAGPDWHLALGRLRDLPRPLRDHRRSRDAARRGRCRARGTSCRPAAARARRSSCSAATCAGSSRTSTTSSRSARTSLYLTPIFPAGSTHRYDATSFDRVDPLLGGDEALASLAARRARARAAADRRPDAQPLAAPATSGSSARGRTRTRRSASSTSSTSRCPLGYESWFGLPHLPKLDWALDRAAPPACAASSRRWLDAGGSTAGGSTWRTWPAATAAST